MFAGVVTELFSIIGLTLAGGLLLLWVCWKIFRELHDPVHQLAPPESSEALWRAVVRMVAAPQGAHHGQLLAAIRPFCGR